MQVLLDQSLSSVDDFEQFSTECRDLYLHFQHRNLEALLSAVKGSIDVLRRRITARCVSQNHQRVLVVVMGSLPCNS